ncbi:MAG TPA: nuclear transport factor 2 family protein [Thermoanaerobaculia bacterium]|nr:nuclear transport factor 2 family protein [Thermoanaerobaculia bacterium]
MSTVQRSGWRTAACAAFLAAALVLPAGAATVPPESPADIATRFLRAFEKKDFKAVGSLFAPGALTSAVNLSLNGPPQLAQVTAAQWVQEAEKGLAQLGDIKIDVLDVKTLEFEQAATVSARFRSTGTVGGKAFTNNGIDTYSMVRVDGAWKILHYTFIELLEIR